MVWIRPWLSVSLGAGSDRGQRAVAVAGSPPLVGVGAVAPASALDGGAIALGLQSPFVGAPAGTGRDARALRRGDRVPEQGRQPGPGPLAVGELATLLGGGHREYAAGQPPGQPFGDPVPRPSGQ